MAYCNYCFGVDKACGRRDTGPISGHDHIRVQQQYIAKLQTYAWGWHATSP